MLDADRWAGPGRRAGNWVLTCCLRRRQRPVAGWAWLFVRRAAHRGLDGKAPWQGTKSECDHWPWALGLGPWNIDRLRRPDNGGGNGVCASRRYVLLDRQAARAGGRAHLSLPVPGNLVSLHLGPCRTIFLACWLTLFGPCLVQKRRAPPPAGGRLVYCPLSDPRIPTSKQASLPSESAQAC